MSTQDENALQELQRRRDEGMERIIHDLDSELISLEDALQRLDSLYQDE